MKKKKLAAIITACAAVIAVVIVIVIPRLTPDDTVEIRDWHDLHGIRQDMDGRYVLMNDLDAGTAGYEEVAGEAADSGHGWQPIGTADDRLTGSFDGRGYEIRDLFIWRPDEPVVGLFGMVDDEAAVRNVGVVNVEVTGGFSVGGLVAANLGTVSNSYCSGNVTGHSVVGGLVGGNGATGTVRNSHSIANVTCHAVGGGLLGLNSRGTVGNAYSGGRVARVYGSDTSLGGLVGRNNGGKITNCYSTASVHYQGVSIPTQNGFAGSIVTDGDYEMIGNFWDTETSGQTSTAGNATGRTTAEMMDIATYVGWSTVAVEDTDRRNTAFTWNIVDGETYPFLSWQPG